jgi:DNA-binding XRE family transcriptional regulator
MRSYAEFRDEIFRINPEIKALWDETAPKRQISLVLATARTRAGLSQQDIAERTGWDKDTIMHLEGALGDVPDDETIAQYIAACEHTPPVT